MYVFYCMYFTVFYTTTTFVSNNNYKYKIYTLFLDFWYFMYKFLAKFFSYTSVHALKKNLKWKPLFKKSSYFGLYRATKNQYLNK